MNPITVACVFVRGNVEYAPRYVEALRSMVARWLNRAHTFVVLKDGYSRVAFDVRIDKIPIPTPIGMAGWWSKIQLFRPGLLRGRVLYLDLDTVVVDALDPIVDFPAPFALVPHAGTFEGRDGLAVVKRFNSSVMTWDQDAARLVYDKWTPQATRRLWGDQDFIGELYPTAATMPAEWFPRLSQCDARGYPTGARVVLAKKPKNVEAVERFPWVREAWQ